MPQKYSDLGKKANDLFDKNFKAGKYDLEVISESKGVKLTTKGALDQTSGAISSSHESKYDLCHKKGTLTATCKQGSKSLCFDACHEIKDYNFKANALFSVPTMGLPTPAFDKLKLNYNHEKANINLATNLNSVNLDAVVALPKVNVGFKAGFDKSFNISELEGAMDMSYGTVDCTFKTTFQGDFNCVIHNAVSDKTSLAISNTHNSKGMSLGLAAKIAGPCRSSNQLKINNDGKFVVSHITPLKIDGACLTLTGEFDATDLSSGNHKFGAGLKFNV